VTKPQERLTISQVCAELQVARSTFYDWRAKGCAPRCLKLPNGEIRVRRGELERWLDEREEVA
jgi:predicted DNA-binding transcriptional regulator AlpA